MTVPAGPAVRKNIVPLLGIAFVVAILCTGLFYGAFASRFTASATQPRHSIVVAAHDLAAGSTVRREDLRVAEVRADPAPRGMIQEPELAAGRRLALAAADGTPILETMLGTAAMEETIPSGMRAMTIRPADSSSILSVLQPGRRIDIQAWSNSGGEAQIRTILDDAEVLSVAHTGEAGSNAITVLVPVSKMDEVALADSAAHVRIALRNSDDSATGSSRAVRLNALFRTPEVEVAHVAHAAVVPPMTVSIVGISEAALHKLDPRPVSGAGFSVRSLQTDQEWEESVRQAMAAKEAVQVTAARVGGVYGDTVQFGNRNWRFRLRFEAPRDSLMWIEPEIVREAGTVVTTERTRGHVSPRASGLTVVLIDGICTSEEDRTALAGAGTSGGVPIRDLMILMRSDAPALRASLPGAGQ